MKANLVGYGVMGQNHHRAMVQNGLEVTTVDPYVEADYPSQLAAPPAEVVCIATPPDQLVHQFELAVMKGAEFILVEKPMATNIEDAEHLIDLAVKYNVNVGVNYTERSNLGVQTLKGRLPEIGTIQNVTALRLGPAPGRPTAGPVLDLMTHDIDVLHYLGLEPMKVTKSVVRDDEAMAEFTLAVGKAQTFVSYRHPQKVRTLAITGDSGSLELDYQTQEITYCVGWTSESPQNVSVVEPLPRTWKAFLDRNPYADHYDGLNALSDALRVMLRAS